MAVITLSNAILGWIQNLPLWLDLLVNANQWALGIGFLLFSFALSWPLIWKGRAKSPLEPSRPKLLLGPSSGPASELLLNVRNQSETDSFRAECCFLERRNDPNSLRQITYPLQWTASQTRDTVIKKERGSENLLIAKFSIDRSDPRERLLEMYFPQFGSDEPIESSLWVQDRAEPGAEYDIEISIWGELDTAKPYVAKFTVRAEKWTGPLEMVRIDE